MTLFTLNKNIKDAKRAFIIYIGVTIFCIAFGIIYEIYSHGVVSYFMLLGFLFPLILGLIPYGTFVFTKFERLPDVIASDLYNAGVATLAAGSYFKGMLEIYGTTRDIYVIIFAVVGCVLLVLGLVEYLISLRKKLV